MKFTKYKNQSGFTLIEVIVVMVIIGIVAVGLSAMIVYVAQNFLFAREADELSQKAQLAMARIKKELEDVKSISTAEENKVIYTLATGGPYQIELSGTAIKIAGQPLIEELASDNGGQTFLTYKKEDEDGTTHDWITSDSINDLAQIQIVFVLDFQGGTNLKFETTINPRRTTVLSVPRLNNN